jgi:hypothetical protein
MLQPLSDPTLLCIIWQILGGLIQLAIAIIFFISNLLFFAHQHTEESRAQSRAAKRASLYAYIHALRQRTLVPRDLYRALAAPLLRDLRSSVF